MAVSTHFSAPISFNTNGIARTVQAAGQGPLVPEDFFQTQHRGYPVKHPDAEFIHLRGRSPVLALRFFLRWIIPRHFDHVCERARLRHLLHGAGRGL